MDLVGIRIIDMGSDIIFCTCAFATSLCLLFHKSVFSPSMTFSCKGKIIYEWPNFGGEPTLSGTKILAQGTAQIFYVTLKLILETKPIEASAVKLSNKQPRKLYFTIYIICLGFLSYLKLFSHLGLYLLHSSVDSSFFLFYSALFF